MLYVRTRDRLVFAVDVRFSRTWLMLADFAGNEIAIESFETIFEPAALMTELAGRIQRLGLAHRTAGRCEGVGIVVPGMVDQDTGRVLNAPQLGWRDVDVRDQLADATGLPVLIENAPIACALARMWLGTSQDRPSGNFVYVTVSDGVGAGVVINGQVVRGHGSSAGEFGHIPLVVDGGAPCLCGARGCLEAYTSNLATLSRYLGHELAPATTRALLHSTGLTIPALIDRAAAGDQRAADAIDTTARYLGAGLAAITNALNPTHIYVGGELTAAWDRIEPVLRAAIASRGLTAAASATPLIPEPASGHPRLRGATALVAAQSFAAPQVA
jgi:predicted NBD/HSP70 family sugar kinase